MIDQIAIANMIGLSQGGRICRQTSEDEFYEQYGNSRIVRAITGRCVRSGVKGGRVNRGESANYGHAGAWVPSGTVGRTQRGGVSVMTAAWRTAVSVPKPEGVSSKRSRTSSKPGSGHVRPSARPSWRNQ